MYFKTNQYFISIPNKSFYGFSDDSLTPARCRRWELSFDLLLKDHRGRSMFEEHLNREFSIENFEFYSKCIEMKNAPVSQVEELAHEIFE